MQPRALSLEPVLIFSFACLVLVVAPLVVAVVWKSRTSIRIVVALIGVIGCSFCFFRLGEAVGRSKSWYHWRRAYQEPLVQLRHYIAEAHTNRNAQAIDAFCREFAKQEPWRYGREPLFETGSFKSFVDVLSGSGVIQTNVQR